MRRMTAEELDEAANRLEEIAVEEEKLRSELRAQIEEFGFTPPRSEKSKRLIGERFQFTLTSGVTVEIKDAEVERLRQLCPTGLFNRLFRTITKFQVAEDAFKLLAGTLPEDAPRSLRVMFNRAVQTKPTAPRLRIEQVAAECATPG